MNQTKSIGAAFLLSGVLLASTAYAQAPGDVIKPVPVDTQSDEQVKPAPVNTDTDRPVGPAPTEKPPIILPVHDVELIAVGNKLRVLGGTPGNRVGILIGLHMVDTPLPGGALLKIEPLLFLTLGVLDHNGEYEYGLHYDGEPTSPLTVFAQAITTVGDTTRLGTSGVLRIEFDGHSNFDIGPVACIGPPNWTLPSHRALRRGMLA